MAKPYLLATNDDGYESSFFTLLVDALTETFDVVVVAPVREQSWIGKAISRHRDVQVTKSERFPCEAWLVDGTPTDCVNIGLSHLVTRRPDVVVSGVNIGYNTNLHLITSSGTVSAALEGAFWGIPALALSQMVPHESFAEITANRSAIGDYWEAQLRRTSQRSVGFAQEALKWKHPSGAFSPIVANINFPDPVGPLTPVERTVPALARSASLFARDEQNPALFRFRFSTGEVFDRDCKTDLNTLMRGHISYSLIDYSRFAVDDERGELTPR